MKLKLLYYACSNSQFDLDILIAAPTEDPQKNAR